MSAIARMHVISIAVFEKKEFEAPVVGHLLAFKFNTRWQASYYSISFYTLFSCVGNIMISYRYICCRAIALPSTEKIV